MAVNQLFRKEIAVKDAFLNFGLLWLRLLTGAGIVYHGYEKLFHSDMSQMITGVGKMGFPHPEIFAWAAALSEFLGGILIATGLFTRTAALFVCCTMTVAAFVALAKDPLQVKELALAYWTISGALIFMGGGALSFDSVFFKKK